jgi:hypothetical protein
VRSTFSRITLAVAAIAAGGFLVAAPAAAATEITYAKWTGPYYEPGPNGEPDPLVQTCMAKGEELVAGGEYASYRCDVYKKLSPPSETVVLRVTTF